MKVNLLPWRQVKRRHEQFMMALLSILFLIVVVLAMINHNNLSQELNLLQTTSIELKNKQSHLQSVGNPNSEQALKHKLEKSSELFFKKITIIFTSVTIMKVEVVHNHIYLQCIMPSLEALHYVMTQAASQQLNLNIQSIKKNNGGFDIVLFEK